MVSRLIIESVNVFHLVPLQAYSYRKVLPILSKNHRVIAFDWLGKILHVT